MSSVVKPTCPSCGADIQADDINVSRGIMLCRACGRMSFIKPDAERSPVAEAMDTWSPDQEPVARPKRARTHVIQQDRQLELHRRTGLVGTAVFLTAWLIGWTACCVFLINEVIRERSVDSILCAIPFVASWFAVSFVLLAAYFGRERLVVGPSTLVYRWKVLVPVRARKVALRDVRTITGFSSVTDSESKTREFGLRIRTTDRDIRFGKGLTQGELLWLADMVRRYIHALDPRVMPPSPIAETQGDSTVAYTAPIEVLQPTYPPHERPADADIVIRRDLSSTDVTRRVAQWGILPLLGVMTFINLFWNGIVAVFLYQLIQDFQWFLFFFLIPFEVIGFVLFVCWLATLTAPFWKWTWTLKPGEIRKRISLMGIGHTRHFELTRLARLELRRPAPTGNEDDQTESLCSLALVGLDDEDITEINDLTENDARWLADELFRSFQELLIKVG